MKFITRTKELQIIDFLDWSETLVFNGERPAHCTQKEWDEYRRTWAEQKHALAPLGPRRKIK